MLHGFEAGLPNTPKPLTKEKVNLQKNKLSHLETKKNLQSNPLPP